jgi:hypothetical protein
MPEGRNSEARGMSIARQWLSKHIPMAINLTNNWTERRRCRKIWVMGPETKNDDADKGQQQFTRQSGRKIWSRVPLGLEPRVIVLAKASINLHEVLSSTHS